ncbi:MAG: hypothetical protein EA399_10595 [Desulfovibrionales bacterium]|nr:MAG: hypothetical protein EA399_10595 [Desulfovibrionales bacterium]
METLREVRQVKGKGLIIGLPDTWFDILWEKWVEIVITPLPQKPEMEGMAARHATTKRQPHPAPAMRSPHTWG